MICVIDYGVGNLRSVAGALEWVGCDYCVSSDPARLRAATKLVLPGVGAFADGMASLTERGLASEIIAQTKQGKPILGICLGAQLLCRSSREFGHHAGLGVLDAAVLPIATDSSDVRVPHVGWNNLLQTRASPLLEGIPPEIGRAHV